MTFQLDRSTVLVLDNDPFVVSGISRMLKRLSVGRVVSATGVDAGLQVIKELDGGLNAALVDFQMPDRHGLQFIKEVRTGRTRARHDMPCLILTDHVQPRLLGLAMALDVDAFLEKPAKIPALKEHLTRAISKPS